MDVAAYILLGILVIYLVSKESIDIKDDGEEV